MLNLIRVGSLGKTYRHVNRYRQIVSILFKYGFDNIIDILKIDKYLEKGLQMISGKRLVKFEKLTPQERVRLIFEELGPTFIKFGQILSTRPDLIPLHFIHELEKLQDNVPEFGFDEVKIIIASEFKLNGHEHINENENENENGKKQHFNVNVKSQSTNNYPFESIEEAPFASASIGQVHRATLKNGDKVAVKIQRPRIKSLIKVDLEILHHLATLIENHLEDLSFFRPVKRARLHFGSIQHAASVQAVPL